MTRLWISALVALLLDQLSKFLVVEWLNLRNIEAINVLPPYLNFRMAWNQGVNFGLFANDAGASRWILILVALLIAGGVTLWVRRARPGALCEISAGLLVGGALGNVVDRLRFGAVADFLNMSCCGFRNPFSFNVADVAVFLGVVGLVLFTGRQKTP
ncbi:signal peptidase II [Thioclava sp. BHET1]|nr:signal peptidase II [Thioclava sp. BHET1]